MNHNKNCELCKGESSEKTFVSLTFGTEPVKTCSECGKKFCSACSTNTKNIGPWSWWNPLFHLWVGQCKDCGM